MLVSNSIKVEPINMNGAIYVFCLILKFVVASESQSDREDCYSMPKKEKFQEYSYKNWDISNHQR